MDSSQVTGCQLPIEQKNEKKWRHICEKNEKNDKKMKKKWKILRKNYNFLEILTSIKVELVLFFIYNNHFYSYMQDINYKNKTKLKLTWV